MTVANRTRSSACLLAELPTGKTVEAVCPQAVTMTEHEVD